VYNDDTYNIDKKGVIIGIAPKVKVIILKHEKNPYSTYLGNRE
jgi:S-adenosylmethionine hydrolase